MCIERVWQLQDAKSRFSEVVEKAVSGEAQVVTKRGEKVVVVIDYARYLELTGQTKSLLEVLRGEPPYTEELVIERDTAIDLESDQE